MARRSRPKGEFAISLAVAAGMFLTILVVQRRWELANLKGVATSAEEFILNRTGMGGQVPEISGFEKVRTFRLGSYRAGLYRVSPAPMAFAPGRFIVYDRDNKPVFKLETLEGAKEPWTTVYDFGGKRGLPIPGNRSRPVYTRNLTGNGHPDIVVGQYSGGDHCCTIATLLELEKQSVRSLGRIEGLDGLPFEGMELRKIDKDASWEIVAHRPSRTICGSHLDAADILSVYAYADGQYTDQTTRFGSFLESVFRENLAKWVREKTRTLDLLQTLAANYAALGQREEGKRFFAMNLPTFSPQLQRMNVDPDACQEDVENLLNRLPSVAP